MSTVRDEDKEKVMSIRGSARSRSIEPSEVARRNGQIGRLLKSGSHRVQTRMRQDVRRASVMHRLVSLGTGILGGAVAGAIVSRVWGLFSDHNEATDPTAVEIHLRQALIAGAVQGVVFGVVKTALARGTAKTYHRLTGSDLKP